MRKTLGIILIQSLLYTYYPYSLIGVPLLTFEEKTQYAITILQEKKESSLLDFKPNTFICHFKKEKIGPFVQELSTLR